MKMRQTRREREKCSVALDVHSGQDWARTSQKPVTPSGFPIQKAGAQLLEPSPPTHPRVHISRKPELKVESGLKHRHCHLE